MNKRKLSKNESELLLKTVGFIPRLEEKESAWRGHIPFSFWLMRLLRPKVFVELGTHWGLSYFSFCQVVHEDGLETKCYAVDTWRGEEQSGSYDEDVHDFVSGYNYNNYSGFSSLLRMTFDDALGSFSSQSIDLLHIDGFHSYEVVKHDFESWLPKLSPGAVVLFHDTNVRDTGFGVWKFWEEVREKYSCTLEFLHSYGLGVLQLDDSSGRKGLEGIFYDAATEKVLQNYFSALGSRLSERYYIGKLEENVRELTQKMAQELTASDGEINNLRNLLNERDDELSRQRSELEGRFDELYQVVQKKEQELNAVLHSSCWRLTAPLRSFVAGIKQLIFLSVRKMVHFRSLLVHYLKRESFFGLLKKTAAVLLREGPGGIVLRFRLHRLDHADAVQKFIEADDCLNNSFLPVSTIDVEAYDLFFIDVFDTAIIRLFSKPTDVFKYLSYLIGDEFFSQKRVKKELTERRNNSHQKDISLSDIYNDFSGYDVKDEYRAERLACVRNNDLYSLYRKIIARGKKVFFVSDMYLDKKFIEEILVSNGYGEYSDVFVSSEDDLIKGDGSRFDWIKNKILQENSHPLHIGDHAVADFKRPKERGISSFHYFNNDFYFRHDSLLYAQYDFLMSENRLGLSFLMGMFRYWKTEKAQESPSFWRQFGFFYGGALVARFCSFVRQEKERLGAGKIFFLARDGDIMKQAFSLLYDDCDSVYMYASRRCMSLPVINESDLCGGSAMVDLYTLIDGVQSAEDILDRFGYTDLDGLRSDLNKTDFASGRLEAGDIRTCLCRNKKEIMEKVARERDVLLDYLEHVGFFDSDNPLIVDVGWRGTIQDALAELVKISGKIDCDINGIYLGVNPSVKRKKQKKGLLFNGSAVEFVDFLNLIELLTASPMDGVVRIEKTEIGEFDYVRAERNEFEAHRQTVSHEIQQGIIEFAKIIKENGFQNIDFMEPEDFYCIFKALQMFPSEECSYRFGAVKHAMLLGNAHEHDVLKFKN